MTLFEQIDREELLIETLRENPGGQYVGTSSIVRITHLPSGIVAQCGAARSQHHNRVICEDMLLSALTHPNF